MKMLRNVAFLTLAVFAFTIFTPILMPPKEVSADNEAFCPVHEHIEIVSQKYGLCSPGYLIWWDDEGCWNREFCWGLYKRHTRKCTHGIQDLCSQCNELTDQCDEHQVTCIGPTWAGGCGGHSKIETWYTCQYDSCPYGPSS